MKKRLIILYLISAVVLWYGPVGAIKKGAAASGVDHSLYAELLNKYIKNGVVIYQGFKNEESKLNAYLKVLEGVNGKTLDRNEQFAFYVNAYNAWTIKLILSGYPGLKSIKDLATWPDSPWKKKICRIDGDMITLDHIEHQILRPGFKDPRVHFAINCASKSCPPLMSKPFTGKDLNRQLDDVTQKFINDTNRNKLEGKKLFVSKIFKWFGDDFNNEIIDFFIKYAEKDLKENLEKRRTKIKIKYLDYDWSLNGY